MEQTKAVLIAVVAVVFWAAPALILAHLLFARAACRRDQSRPVPAVKYFALAFCWPIALAFYWPIAVLSLCLMTLRPSSPRVPTTPGHQEDDGENWRRSLWAAVGNRYRRMVSKMRKSPEPHLADVESQVTADAVPKIQPNGLDAARGPSSNSNAQDAGSPRHGGEGLPTQYVDRQWQAVIDPTVPPPGYLATMRETTSRFATLDERPPPPTYEARHSIAEDQR